MHRPQHFHGFILKQMNYLPTLVGLFFQWKKLTNKTCQTIYFTYQKSPCECFIKRAINVPDQQVLIFLSMILLLKKLFQKIFYLAFTNTCANKDFLKNHVAFEVSIKGNQWTCKFPEWRGLRPSTSRKGSWQCYIKCWKWSFQIWTSHKFSYIWFW